MRDKVPAAGAGRAQGVARPSPLRAAPRAEPDAPAPRRAARDSPWGGMGHAAIVAAVVGDRRRLQFTAATPDGVALLANAAMAYEPAERPTFQDILDVLAPLEAALTAP